LRGKNKPIYTPHIDTGDGVIVINASKIKVTGKKLKNKIYRFYSGYPGGLKEIPLEKLLSKSPEKVLRLAVKRMLPSNPLGRKMLKKLKIYPNENHPHQGLKPVRLEV
jgi:large subunit ribosomal protein L13